MAKIYLTAAQSNQLDSEASLTNRLFTRAATRQVWNYATGAWGTYDSAVVTGANSLSDAGELTADAVNDYKEFEVEIPALAHAVDIVIQFCNATGDPLFAKYKDANELHCYDPGLVPFKNGMVQMNSQAYMQKTD